MTMTNNINNIDVIKYHKNINNELIKDKINNIYTQKKVPLCTECTICLEKFEINNNVIKLDCCHVFHPKCIYEWLNPNKINTCPTCRNIIIY